MLDNFKLDVRKTKLKLSIQVFKLLKIFSFIIKLRKVKLKKFDDFILNKIPGSLIHHCT